MRLPFWQSRLWIPGSFCHTPTWDKPRSWSVPHSPYSSSALAAPVPVMHTDNSQGQLRTNCDSCVIRSFAAEHCCQGYNNGWRCSPHAGLQRCWQFPHRQFFCTAADLALPQLMGFAIVLLTIDACAVLQAIQDVSVFAKDGEELSFWQLQVSSPATADPPCACNALSQFESWAEGKLGTPGPHANATSPLTQRQVLTCDNLIFSASSVGHKEPLTQSNDHISQAHW